MLLAVLLTADGVSAQQRRIQLDDLAKVVTVSDPQISPDGKSIVCVVSRPNLEEDRYDNELVLIDVASSAQKVLISDRRDVSSPRWSQNGDRLAFLAVVPYASDKKDGNTKKEDGPQVFVRLMSSGDTKKITNARNGVEQFAWRPNGRDIAYVTSDDPPNQKEIERHNESFEVGDNDFLATSALTSSHIWLTSAEGGAARRLTSGSWSLLKSAIGSPASPISWAPDGKTLTFTRQEYPNSGDADLTTVQVLDVETGEIRKLTRHRNFEGYGQFSPDGSQLAYFYRRDGDFNNENEVFVASMRGGDGIVLTREIDRNPWRAIWMPDGQSLLIAANDGTQVSLWLQPLQGKGRKLSLGEVIPTYDYWLDVSTGPKGEIAFPGNTVSSPSELYYLPSPTDAPKRLTSFNQQMTALQLGKMEGFEWQGPDGFREDGILIYPPDFNKDKKYPLVVRPHGGPQAAVTMGFDDLGQLMAARDYIVFEPNFRGSDNLGNAYQRAVANDAGDGPGRDVMSGIDALKKLGFVDESKIAVTGWSYGGFMTTWLIEHYHIWRAAVAGAPATNWAELYSLSNFGAVLRYVFKGSPWVGDNLKDYVAQSPITYASQINTPTLILHDTGDPINPITQSYELYHALKDNGVRVQFVAYPIAGHVPADPVSQQDVNRRWLNWLDQYLK
jgi:dipeptidyl aminopeptidase/acylaminoacyl peptidase